MAKRGARAVSVKISLSFRCNPIVVELNRRTIETLEPNTLSVRNKTLFSSDGPLTLNGQLLTLPTPIAHVLLQPFGGYKEAHLDGTTGKWLQLLSKV